VWGVRKIVKKQGGSRGSFSGPHVHSSRGKPVSGSICHRNLTSPDIMTVDKTRHRIVHSYDIFPFCEVVFKSLNKNSLDLNLNPFHTYNEWIQPFCPTFTSFTSGSHFPIMSSYYYLGLFEFYHWQLISETIVNFSAKAEISCLSQIGKL
jgi:hypothetical protein